MLLFLKKLNKINKINIWVYNERTFKIFFSYIEKNNY